MSGSFLRSLRLLGTALCVLTVAIIPAYADVPPNVSVGETTKAPGAPGPGFGDRQNSYSWAMAWFNHKLYVGTVRNELCVEGITQDFYAPGKGYYSTKPGIGVTCPANKYDLNLQAEIWSYDPSIPNPGARWTRVFQSPNDIPIPGQPGKFVARDIGFRDMMVYTDPNDPTHTPALYALGITADEYIPQLQTTHPPRILRSTDGTHWTDINVPATPVQYNSGNGTNTYYPMGYRAMAVYNGRLFVTATPDLTGDGPVMEVKNASGPAPTLTQVSPPTLDAYELQVFNGQLYVGAGSYQSGYSVWRTNATGQAPFQYTPVVTNGAGRGPSVTSVVSMHVLRNQLYVGASGWYNSIFPASEMIRINPDNTWQVVVGAPRADPTTGQLLFPISGFPDGFGNPFSAHFWRMQDFQNGLVVGTNDWSYLLQTTPLLNTLTQSQWGFDIYGSCDGQFWSQQTQNAFGDGQFNFGARTMATSADGRNLFIGSANHAQGTNVWRLMNTDPVHPVCPATTGGSAQAVTPLTPTRVLTASRALDQTAMPGELEADVQSCATLLSWAPAQGASQYRILRSEFSTQSVSMSKPQHRTSAIVPDEPLMSGPRGTDLTGQIAIPGPYVAIGTTTHTYFVDQSAQKGHAYLYTVQAINAQGSVTYSSNVAYAPSQAPAASFASVTQAINDKAKHGQIRDGGAALLALVMTAQKAAAQGDRNGAVAALDQALNTLRQPGSNMATSTAQDLAMGVSGLERKISLAPIACDQGASVGVGPGH